MVRLPFDISRKSHWNERKRKGELTYFSFFFFLLVLLKMSSFVLCEGNAGFCDYIALFCLFVFPNFDNDTSQFCFGGVLTVAASA